MNHQPKCYYQDGDFISKVYGRWATEHLRLLWSSARLSMELKWAERKRAKISRQYGIEIPDTIALSLTTTCNRRCHFCGAATAIIGSHRSLSQPTLTQILKESAELGIRRVVLVGGEPLSEPVFDELIANHPSFFFLIFTNGRLLDRKRLELFSQRANYALVVNVSATDDPLVCPDQEIEQILKQLAARELFFGYSATVHCDNSVVFGNADVYERLADLGARFGILFDYLPDFDTPNNRRVVPREQRMKIIETARQTAYQKKMAMMCAPEDEELTGGCAAAGRQVIHVSAGGAITPCPFVPYAHLNIETHTLKEALSSAYFTELRRQSRLWDKLDGACAFRAGAQRFHSVNEQHGVSRIAQ